MGYLGSQAILLEPKIINEYPKQQHIKKTTVDGGYDIGAIDVRNGIRLVGQRDFSVLMVLLSLW